MGVLGGRSPPNTPDLPDHHGDSQRISLYRYSTLCIIKPGSISFFRTFLFYFPLHLVNLFLSQVGDFFETGDAKRLALGLAPA